MSAPDTRRPFWLTWDEHRMRLHTPEYEDAFQFRDWDTVSRLQDENQAAWDAAPADPAEAAYEVIVNFVPTGFASQQGRSFARAVLSALGCVPARETNEKPNA